MLGRVIRGRTLAIKSVIERVKMDNIKGTSRTAYLHHSVEGHTISQREHIMRCLSTSGPLTRFQISRLTGIRLTSVCGRVKALIDKGQIEITHEAEDPMTGKAAEYLKAVFIQARMFF